MTETVSYKDKNGFAEAIRELMRLSIEMNDAVNQNDIKKIEQIHLQKQELINKLNLLLTAQTWHKD